MKVESTVASPHREAEAPKAGDTLGSYLLEESIGKGAMGDVFKARHVKLGRTVALKILNARYATNPEVVQRFFREARVVNEIGHAHIVDVTDLVEEPGRSYLVMELLEGESLRARLDKRGKKRMALAECVRVAVQIAEALHAAHERGVVHRDLKPDNVFVTRKDGRDFVKILDFGVAKLTEPMEGDVNRTIEGQILGTPVYMAPEQAQGFDVDRRADVWALGVVLYEMLAGRVPFDAETFSSLIVKLAGQEAQPLPAKTPRGEPIPRGLADAVMRCLEKKPSDRFKTMEALVEAIEPFGGKKRRGRSRSRLLAPVAALLALAAFGAAGWQLGMGPRVKGWLDAARSRIAAPRPAPAPAAAATPHAEPPPKPRPPTHVEIEAYSKPEGATVTRVDNDEVLGKTPLKVKVPRVEKDVALRFTLSGYEPMTASVDLGTGGSANVAMAKKEPPRKEPPKKETRREPARKAPAHAKKPPPAVKKKSTRR